MQSSLVLALSGLLICACGGEPVVSLGDDRPAQMIVDAGVYRADAEDPNEEFEDEHECSEPEFVCGVDGMTYLNSCRARQVDAGVAHLGVCK